MTPPCHRHTLPGSMRVSPTVAAGQHEGRAKTMETDTTAQIERIFTEWDKALGDKDVDVAISLYTPDRRHP
jgi:hypothetical protein